MELKQLTLEQESQLLAPLPIEALKTHPTKSFLTTINPAYVIERMNLVFGIGNWTVEADVIEQGLTSIVNDKVTNGMVVLNVHVSIPSYGIFLHSFGGNDNADKGDAYKGAQTDGFTKCCSYLGIGLGVWKNEKTNTTEKKSISQPTNDVQSCPHCSSTDTTHIKSGVSKKTGKSFEAFNKCNSCEKGFW